MNKFKRKISFILAFAFLFNIVLFHNGNIVNIAKASDTNILLGDFDQSNTVDATDRNDFIQNYSKSFDTKYDIAPAVKGADQWNEIYSVVTKDSKIDILDYIVVNKNQGKIKPTIVQVKPTSIAIGGGNKINVGESIDLTATVTYSDGSSKNETVTWSSSDTAIATVSASGKVTGVTKGTVQIKAEKDGIEATKTISIEEIVVLNGIKVYLKTTWEKPTIHYWNVTPTKTPSTWPGVEMVNEGDGWYSFTFEGAESTSLLFSNSGSDKTGDLTRTKGQWWYEGGKWYDSDPRIDLTPPTIEPTPSAGNREETSLSVELIAKDNQDKNPKVYYTKDGSTPVVGQNQYTNGILITQDTVIKAIAVDASNNVSDVLTFEYKLGRDVTPPVITETPKAGKYESAVSVNLSVTDNKDSGLSIYYTTDGSEPKEDPSQLYKGAISIGESKTIKALSVDKSGNKAIQSFRYTIGAGPARKDFREETIYFLMTTRFYDGDPSNNVHAWAGESGNQQNIATGDPAWRGDFKGLIEKLDYIKALGFSAIWVTPVVKNASGYDYHGYHAINHSEVDPRYESPGFDYQKLIDEIHARDMKIVQDVVLNHTSNFGEENLFPLFYRKDPVGTVKNNGIIEDVDTVMQPGPEFGRLAGNYHDLTDPQQYEQRWKAIQKNSDNIFHDGWTGGSWEAYPVQVGSMAGDCQDLNTENPLVTDYMIKAYNKYIEMGVDAFRIDTVKHISRLTFNKEFNPAFKAKGGNDFFMFGEVCTRYRSVWNDNNPNISTPFFTWKGAKDSSYPWGTREEREASAKQYWEDNKSTDAQPKSDNHLLKNNTYRNPDYSQFSGLGVIDFPMHWSFRSAREAFGICVSSDDTYNDATWNVTYIDSHDYAPDGAPENQRFAQPQEVWAENLSLLFTFRGIPTIYYGSEIEFKKGEPIDLGPNILLEKSGRAYFGPHIEGSLTTTDFGVYSGATGAVAETLNHPLAQHIRRLNLIRRAIPALQKGQYSVEGVSGDGMAYKRRYTNSAEGVDSFVLVTVSGGATFSGIPNGTYVDAVTGDKKVVSGGSLSISCTGQGNMRAYVLELPGNTAPGKIGEDGKYLK